MLATIPTLAAADTQWILDQSTVSYHVSHPLHNTDGVSHMAKGKGVCHAGQCDFLIAVPVKSFDSGDSNRDLHMLQVTRGGEFPLVTVRTQLPEAASASTSIHADLEIQFAGQTFTYKQVALQLAAQGKRIQIKGISHGDSTVYQYCRLLAVGKNEMPVRIDMTWHAQ